MASFRRSFSCAVAGLCLAALSGCESDDTTEAPSAAQEGSLEIFSWWTASGEAEALSALLDVYTDENPKVAVSNAAATDPTSARTRLASRLETGEPPDSFQAVSGVDLLSWVDKEKMVSLEDVPAAADWSRAFPEAVLDSVRRDGKLYGVPVNIERDNNLYYNVALLEAEGITPPESLADFAAACAALQPTDVVPLAVPAAGWVLALVGFETLLPAVSGGEYYTDFFAGNADPEGPEFRSFLEAFRDVLECSNVRTAEPGWGANADLVYSGDAAMFVMGDWAKGYFEGGQDAAGTARPKWIPGKDFDVVAALGSGDYFTFNSAVFGLPLGAQHPSAAKAFLSVVGSQTGQEAFNAVKGSVPARIDADLSGFDDMVRGAAQDFKDKAEEPGRLLPGYASLTTFDFQVEINPSLLVFAVGGERARELDQDNVPEDESAVPPLDIDYLIAKVSANYAILKR